MQQLTSGTRCCCRGPARRVGIFFGKRFFWKAGWMHNFYFVCRSIFWKTRSQADRCTSFFVLKKNLLESPGRGSVLFKKKYAAINQRNVLVALPGGDFFLKRFFWKAGSIHNFYFVCRRIFWKARVPSG